MDGGGEGAQTGMGRQAKAPLAANRDTPPVDVSNLSWQVSGWRAEAHFHSCGGSAGLGSKTRTGFPIITRPCDPRDHDTLYVVFCFAIHVKGWLVTKC